MKVVYTLFGAYLLALVLAVAVRANPMPKGWHAPKTWLAGALCVHSGESGNWHIHNPPYANGFQFMYSTWVSAGGLPSTWISASPLEQIYRAWIVWSRDGQSWREWPNTSRACGLT